MTQIGEEVKICYERIYNPRVSGHATFGKLNNIRCGFVTRVKSLQRFYFIITHFATLHDLRLSFNLFVSIDRGWLYGMRPRSVREWISTIFQA